MRNVDDLSRELAAASSWRKTELTKLMGKFDFQYRKTYKKDPSDSSNTIKGFQYIEDVSGGQTIPLSALDKRAMYLLTYSHWEGYVKQAIRIYLSTLGYVSFQEVDHHPRVIHTLVRSRLEKHKNDIEKTKADSLELKDSWNHLMVQLDRDQMQIENKEINTLCDTRSNLKMGTLKTLLLSLDLPIPEFFYRNSDVIDTMVNIRNGIAHGDSEYRSSNFPEEIQDGLPRTIDFVLESFLELQNILIIKADDTFTT